MALVLAEGWLYKLNSGARVHVDDALRSPPNALLGPWRRRYFRLTSESLAYYHYHPPNAADVHAHSSAPVPGRGPKAVLPLNSLRDVEAVGVAGAAAASVLASPTAARGPGRPPPAAIRVAFAARTYVLRAEPDAPHELTRWYNIVRARLEGQQQAARSLPRVVHGSQVEIALPSATAASSSSTSGSAGAGAGAGAPRRRSSAGVAVLPVPQPAAAADVHITDQPAAAGAVPAAAAASDDAVGLTAPAAAAAAPVQEAAPSAVVDAPLGDAAPARRQSSAWA